MWKQETNLCMISNPELTLAQQFVANTGNHLFLTGKAGTGKTTFLRQLKEENPKRMIVLAPTGIAAINAGGMTIHSFFQLPFAPYIPETSFNAKGEGNVPAYRYRFGKEKINIIRSTDLLVIDEISMVRADLLDAIDDALRKYRDHSKPFGGVQLLMIGDLQQLAPVVKEEDWKLLKPYYDTPYFFSSQALKKTDYYTIELKTVYRQSDTNFLTLLNHIRENQINSNVLDTLNRRYIPNFNPRTEEGYIRLVTHNIQAQRINESELGKLSGRSFAFKAKIEDKFPEYSYPTDLLLELKKGAQVMFVKNDSSGEHRYYNGMIGEVTNVSPQGIEVRSKESGEFISVHEEEWTNSSYVLDKETMEIREEIEGTFKQYPLKLAWAITIHKSQGLTFEKAIIDASGSFAHGQTYVALSRCRTLEGLVLSNPIPARAIISDATVDTFTEKARQTIPTENRFRDLQRTYFLQLLSELFKFEEIEWSLHRYTRLIDEHLYRLYPKLLEALKEEEVRFKEKINNVAQKFSQQYTRLTDVSTNYHTDTHLQERIKAASVYFSEQLIPLDTLLWDTIPISDNKEIRKRIKDTREELVKQTSFKKKMLDFTIHEGFQTSAYLKQKAIFTLKEPSKTEHSKIRQEKERNIKSNIPSDIQHPLLYNQLIKWRNEKATTLKLPVYTIIQQKAILGISNLLPTNIHMLATIPYLGKRGINKYGQEIIEIVLKYKEVDKE